MRRIDDGLLRLFLFLPLLFTLLTGCGNLSYLAKLGWHQSSIIFHSLPVQEIMEDEGVDPGIKEKIHFIQEVKRYGEEKLGLTRTKSYSKYVEVKGPVLYVITASDKDRLQPYHWSFPITGKVTYKSFFTKKECSQRETISYREGIRYICPAGGCLQHTRLVERPHLFVHDPMGGGRSC